MWQHCPPRSVQYSTANGVLGLVKAACWGSSEGSLFRHDECKQIRLGIDYQADPRDVLKITCLVRFLKPYSHEISRKTDIQKAVFCDWTTSPPCRRPQRAPERTYDLVTCFTGSWGRRSGTRLPNTNLMS